MPKINDFHSRWEDISDIIHDMKNALTRSIKIEQQSREIRKIIGDGLDKIYKSINGMMNNEGVK